MGLEIIYKRDTGQILLSRRIAAPRDDLAPGEGEDKIFLSSDLAGRPVTAFRVDPKRGELVLRKDFAVPQTESRLRLTASGTVTSPIDGIDSISADGKAQAAITVQKRNVATGRTLTRAKDDNLLNIRTTAGTLSTGQLRLVKGRGAFNLTSSTETVVARVRVWSEDIPGATTLAIEFAPT